MTQKILVIGATSAMAQATAKIYATRGAQLFLVGRNQQRLDTIAADLRLRGAPQVDTYALDITATEQHTQLIEQAYETLGQIDVVLIAHGTLPDQAQCQLSYEQSLRELNVNFLSVVSLLNLLGNRFEAQRSGCIAVITSVAGDRGRKSNYVYGAAKGGLTIFLQGLRHRLASANVSVLTIKPGFVDTPMTQNFKKGLLWAKPDAVAKAIVKAIDKRRAEIYVPWFWWGIMSIIKSVPNVVFNRLNL